MIIERKTKTLLATTFISFFLLIQLYESLHKRNDWPFSSFAMYSQTLAHKDSDVVLVAYFLDGERQVMLPWDLFPIDYYKARSMMNDLFLKDDWNILKEKKEIIAKMLSERIPRRDLVKLEFLKVVASKNNLENINQYPSNAELLYVYRSRNE